MADLTSQIETNAGKPKAANIDGQQVQQHSLDEQIEADRYLKSEAAGASKKRGINLARLKPPGTVGP